MPEPEYADTVYTPVTVITETEDGVTVVGFPSDSSTGVLVDVVTTPPVGDPPEPEGQ